MPILRVDKNGLIYKSSRDRDDGRGFGEYPEACGQSDVTLGNVYLKAQAARTREVINRKRAQAELDRRDAHARMQNQKMKQLAHAQEMAKHKILEHPEAKKAVLKAGLQLGCDYQYSTAMSGNVMTANGQYGWKGMSRDQQIIHNAVTGMGKDTAPRANPILKEQQKNRRLADHLLRLNAKPGVVARKTRV
jgi:hypothetical protein